MSNRVNEIIDANEKYSAQFGDKSNLPGTPAKRIAILTCMDSRLDPAKFAGLNEGDAHVIRNAGGRASDDAIRSLVISYKLLGTREWFVIHHTDCGMESISNDVMADLLKQSLKPAVYKDSEWIDENEGQGSDAGEKIDWLTIDHTEQSVIDDVETIKNHPLVPEDIEVHGFLFDVKTGKLIEINNNE